MDQQCFLSSLKYVFLITVKNRNKGLTFSGLSIIDGYFGSVQHHILPLPALLTTLAIPA